MNRILPVLLSTLVLTSTTLMASDASDKKHTPDSVAKEYGFKDSQDFKKMYDSQSSSPSTYSGSSKRHTPDSVSKEFGFKDSQDFKEMYDNQ